jgi:hypothetical protein
VTIGAGHERHELVVQASWAHIPFPYLDDVTGRESSVVLSARSVSKAASSGSLRDVPM